MRALASILVILLTVSPAATQTLDTAPSPDPTRLHIALAGLMAAQGADLATTMYALGTNRADEANPLFDPLTHTPWVAGAAKMSLAALFGYVMLKNHKAHPKLTFWLTVAGAGAYTYAAVHNARVAR